MDAATPKKFPRGPRNNETIGGGFFVFRRHRSTGRIKMAPWPFEHASREAAETQAAKHAFENPGYVFEVVEVVSCYFRGDASPVTHGALHFEQVAS